MKLPASIQKLLPLLLGPAERFPLSNRFFSGVSFATSLLCLGTTAINTAAHLEQSLIIASLVNFLLFGCMYYLSRVRGIFKPLVPVGAVVLLTYVSYTWVHNGGSNGATHYFLIILPLFYIAFGSMTQKVVLTIIYCCCSAGLLTLEYLRPDIIVGYSSATDRYGDVLFATLATQLGIIYLVGLVLREFYKATERLEQMRAKSEQRFGEVADSIPVMICELRHDLSIEYMNRTGIEFGGYSEEDLHSPGMLQKLIADDDWPAVKSSAETILAGGSVPVSEYRITTKAGAVKNVLVKSAARHRDGVIDGIRLYIIDITEKKLLELQYLKAQKMESVGMLAGGIAHDFNNILTGISGYAELIKNLNISPGGAPTYRDLDEYVTPIMTASRRASELIRRLMIFSRQQPLQTADFDLREIMIEVEQFLSHTIDKKIAIRLKLPERTLVVHGDRALLESSIMNLCVNARDAMPHGGILTLSCNHTPSLSKSIDRSPENDGQNGYAVIAVTDSGIGMTPEVQSHLFEPFFSTKAVGKGTGLGLASVYGTVKGHNGHIEVESAPGNGTTFTLYLPLAAAGAQCADEGTAAVPAGQAPQKILVVDDEQIIGGLVSEMLTLEGHEVMAFTSPAKALFSFKEAPQSYTLAIVDMIMPGMSGIELIAELRKVSPGIGVVLMSGYAGSGDTQVRPADLSIISLAKPFEAKTLYAAVARAVVRKAAP